MSPARDLVLQFYRAFDQRQIEAALALLAPNFTAHMAGIPEPLDRDGFSEFGLQFYNAFAQGQHQFDQILVAGDRVVTSGTFTATHLGSFQGLPPTGKAISMAVMHIDRVDNGQIVEHWGQGDALSMLQQLGMQILPSPGLFISALKHRFGRAS